MKINSNIFRAYDVRGIYPKEIDEDIAYRLGKAFVVFLEKKQKLGKLNIVVGRDNRLSSPSLFGSLTKGIIEQGGNVIDIGFATTPMLYFAVAHFGFDGGINITASHNPSQYNGFKLVRKKAIPISEKNGIKEIKKMVLKGNFKGKKKGKKLKKKVLEEYIEFNWKRFNPQNIKPFKIVVDTANAITGTVIPKFFKRTNCKIYHLYSKLDGSFPNHNPDPLIKENLKKLCRKIKLERANLGVAFDGDGDRIIFVDEKNKIISGDFITALIAELILKKKPKSKIFYDIRSSNIVKEVIKENNGIPIAGRIGHSFVKEKMRKEEIAFAGEFSGHYYHKDHYFCECPFYVLLKILKILSEKQEPISKLIRPFKKYFHSGEVNFKVKNKKKALEALRDKFRGGKTLKIDGLRVDFKDWWFLVRLSNTEPVVRLTVEAKTKRLLKQKTHFISNLLHS